MACILQHSTANRQHLEDTYTQLYAEQLEQYILLFIQRIIGKP